MSLQSAIESLYRIAVVDRKSTSTIRLSGLAQYCAEELARRGLAGADTEVLVPGGGRDKYWDVAWSLHGKPRLVISLKSILKNLAGTVPNRIDDLMGEVTNVQMYSPEIVAGYVMVFDGSSDVVTDRRAAGWAGHLRERLHELSGRRAPSWSIGMVEAAVLIEVDFSAGPVIRTPESVVHEFFDRLVEQVKFRNPILLES